MMQPLQTPGILSALPRQPMSPDTQGMSSELQALLKLDAASAAGKVNQTAPGPGGRPIPTVAAQKMQQAAQQILPQQSQPQDVSLPDIAQNAAIGSNITGMQQQNAQKALMDQMLEQQKAKAQQPVLAAEGGIASLAVDGMDDYADGGVVGYNGTETSEVNLGGVSGIPYYAPGPSEERERLNRLPIDALEKLLELLGQGGRRLVKGTTFDPEYNKPKLEALPEETPQPVVPMIPNKGLEAPTGGQAPREERRAPPAPRMDSGIAAPRQAATRQAAAPATIPGEDLYQQALALADQYKGSDGRTAAQIERDRLAEYQRRGLPDLRRAAEERMKQVGEFDAETRRQFVEGNKDAMRRSWELGILQPGARNLTELFGGAARSMIGEEGRQSAAAAALRVGERAQMILDNQIREALDKADKAAADGDITTAQAEKAKAQEFANKKLDVQREMMMNRAKDVLGYQQVMDAERLRQSGADRRDAAGRQLAPAIKMLFEGKLAAAAQAGQNINDPAVKNAALIEAIREASTSPANDARAAALELKKREALSKNVPYKALEARLSTTQDPATLAAIQEQMAQIERGYGIGNIDIGAGQRKVIDFSSIGAQ